MTYDQWMDETKIISATYYNTHGENLPGYTDVGHILYRRAYEQDRWPTLDHALAEWTGWTPTPGPQPGPTPGPSPEPVPQHSQISASFYTAPWDPRLNCREFAGRLRDLGCTGTRVWLVSAWATGENGPGQVNGWLPWKRNVGGMFDLWTPSPQYHDRLYEFAWEMDSAGITPTLTGWELYSWSDRKQGMLWVPDQTIGPFQNNVQGIVYSDDAAFNQIGTRTGEHGFLEDFYGEVVSTLQGLKYQVEIGNEMPEKPMHERLRDAWRRAGYTGPIQVNRQEDTPGQYDNMRIGTNYDRIAFHGKKTMDYLDERFEDEPNYKTFGDFYLRGTYNPSRIVLSSDGCRKTTTVSDAYDYPRLSEVAKDGLDRGFGYEHQLALKLRTFTEGVLDLNDMKYDAEFLKGLQR